MSIEMIEKKEILEETEELDNSAELLWQEMYELAKKYYTKNHHLNMPLNFRTINGVDYDKDGLKLGIWIFYQQRNYNLLSVFKIFSLQEMNLFKNIRKDTEVKQEFCMDLGIENEEDKNIIERTPMDELIAKFNYLLENNTPISINGNLNEIFYMSAVNIEENYGLTIEELITLYYHQAFTLTRTGE